MGKVIELAKYKKQPTHSPQVVAAQMTVEDLRATLFALPSTQARVEFMQIIIAQLCLWTIKSGYYERPADVLRAWVNKKVEQYSRQRSEG